MNEPKRPPTLAEIMRANPEAREYMHTLNKRIAAQYQDEPIACEVCGGLGVVRVELPINHPQFGKPIPCPGSDGKRCPVLAKQQDEQYTKLNLQAQIPLGYRDLTLDSWQELEQYPEYMAGKYDAYGAALAFLAARDDNHRFSMDDAAEMVNLDVPEVDTGKRNSIVYFGAPGLGKTSLAVSIARRLLDGGEGVIYVQLRRFFDDLIGTFGDNATENEDDVLNRYRYAPVLIIDEFGVDIGKSDWRSGRAYDLVDYRYANQKPTIITTNYSPDRLEVWGLPTAHRLQAMAHWIELTGLELRRREPVRRSR